MDSAKPVPVTAPRKLTLRLSENGRVQLAARNGATILSLESMITSSPHQEAVQHAKEGSIYYLKTNTRPRDVEAKVILRSGNTVKLSFQYLGTTYGLNMQLDSDGQINALGLKERVSLNHYQHLASFGKKSDGMAFINVNKAAYGKSDNDFDPADRFSPTWHGNTLQITDHHSENVYSFDLSQPYQEGAIVRSSKGSTLQIKNWNCDNSGGRIRFHADGHNYEVQIYIDGNKAVARLSYITTFKEKPSFLDQLFNYLSTEKLAQTTAFASLGQMQESVATAALAESIAATAPVSAATVPSFTANPAYPLLAPPIVNKPT